MNLILLGAPGSGKGTLAELLSSELAAAHISPGDILREEAKQGNPLGKIATPFMEKGELVPDEIILKMMERRLSQPDCQKGFILDGFPRTLPQAEELDETLRKSNRNIDFALEFEISEQIAIKRLEGRRVCSVCGADFNIYTKPPRKTDMCDVCGSRLFQRRDDQQQVISNRLRVYRQETLPVKEYYNHQGKLIRINSEPGPDVVLKRILKLLEFNGTSVSD